MRGGSTLKRIIFVSLLILLLAACNSPQETSPDDNEALNEEEQMEEPVEQEKEVDQEKAENTQEEPAEETSESSEEEKEDNPSSKIEENEEADKHQELVDLAYDIFEAQNNQDYDFLQSVLSKGTKLDKKNNTFHFENVTYPHDQKFLTEEELGEVEFRYTHEESTDEVIVGFGAINYEEESSFTIDFVFIHEDDTWKMNDMDINK